MVIVVVVGFMIYRSTAPGSDVVPEGESMLKEEVKEGAATQFLQVQPDSTPPLPEGVREDKMEAKEVAAPESESEATEQTAVSSGPQATISMTDVGFSPATITVAAGTTISFVNDGQALHWPASFIHPAHQVLSGFDSNRGVATGDRYSYTFTEAGSWQFHDHLNPSVTGTITVE